MVSLDWTVTRERGVTFVTCLLDTDGVDREVRLRNELAGPLWPPRRQGVPERGWTDDGFAGVVGPGTHALGFSSPAPPTEPPVTLVSSERAEGTDVDSPAALVRQLGDPRPPRDALGDHHQERPAGNVPPAVESWLDAVEQRLRQGATDGSGATLAADRRALDAVETRVRSLSERLDG